MRAGLQILKITPKTKKEKNNKRKKNPGQLNKTKIRVIFIKKTTTK